MPRPHPANLTPLDIARILRALDLVEFSESMREVSLDVSVFRPSEVRARALAQAGTRAMFVAFTETRDEVETRSFTLEATPTTETTTI